MFAGLKSVENLSLTLYLHTTFFIPPLTMEYELRLTHQQQTPYQLGKVVLVNRLSVHVTVIFPQPLYVYPFNFIIMPPGKVLNTYISNKHKSSMIKQRRVTHRKSKFGIGISDNFKAFLKKKLLVTPYSTIVGKILFNSMVVHHFLLNSTDWE